LTDCSRLENTDISNKREFELLIRRRGSFERIEGYLEDLEEGNREIAEDPMTKEEKQGGPGG
jgi:hypothetical protein